jgi:eukaryotic-like serine/threonine-protein kinase
MKPHKLAVLLLLCLPLFGEEVSMFRGDAQRSGSYQAAGVPQLHGVKWKFRTHGQVISSPTIVGGTIYVGSTRS